MVLWPGFGPGSATREAAILDRTILPERVFIYCKWLAFKNKYVFMKRKQKLELYYKSNLLRCCLKLVFKN